MASQLTTTVPSAAQINALTEACQYLDEVIKFIDHARGNDTITEKNLIANFGDTCYNRYRHHSTLFCQASQNNDTQLEDAEMKTTMWYDDLWWSWAPGQQEKDRQNWIEFQELVKAMKDQAAKEIAEAQMGCLEG